MKDLSIVAVNWRSVDYLRKCLHSVYQFTRRTDFEFIIVNNDPDDASVEALEKEFPAVVLLHTGENRGFAYANNFGFACSSGRNILFLNPDTEAIGDAIDVMLQELDGRHDAGIIGCKLLNADLTAQTSCIQRFPAILNQVFGVEWLRLRWPKLRFWGIRSLFEDSPAPVEVEVISGACLMIKREVFEQVGRFSEEYFMYAEDADLCFKVHQAGYKTLYVGQASFIHHGGGSSRRNEVNEWATIMQRRAIFQYFRKTRGRMYAEFYRVCIGVMALCRLALIGSLMLFRKPLAGRWSAKAACAKWMAIFKWSIAMGNR
jgi:hypothetical protein